MSSNSIVVTLTGDGSQLEGVLGRINGKVNGLGDSVGRAGGIMGTMLKGLGGAAIGTAIAGIGALTATVAGLVSTLPQAASQTNQILASAGAIADGLGVSFEEARDITRGLTGDIAKMAAELPGATSLYTDLSNQISDTLARASGGNLDTFRDQLKDITDSAGVLSVTAGIDGSEAGSTLDRLLSGSLTLSGLRQLRLGEQNPRLLALLEESLGGQEMADLALEDRVTLLNDVLNRAIPDEALDEMRESAASALEGVKTSLFDQNVGLFGWLRGLSEFDGANAYEILGESLGAVLDLGKSAGNLLETLGFSGTDPMVIVGRVLETVETYADRARAFLEGLNVESLGSFSFDPEAIARRLAAYTSQAFDRLGFWLASLDWTEAGKTFGAVILGATRTVRAFILGLDYGSILAGIGQAIWGLTKAVASAVGTITRGAAQDLLEGGSKAIRGLVRTISEGIRGIARRLWEAITSIDITGALQNRGILPPADQRTIKTGPGANDNKGGPGGLPGEHKGLPGEASGLPQNTLGLPKVETSRASRREIVRSQPQVVNLTTQTVLDGSVIYEKTTQHALGALQGIWEETQGEDL